MYDKSQTKQPSKTNTKQAHLTARNVSPAYRNPSPANLIQLAVYDPALLSHQDSVMLQRTIGNQAVGRLLEAHEASKSDDIQQTANKPEETEKNRPLTNRTGLPDNLNAGVKNLSGDSPNAVRAPGIDVIQRVLIDGENIIKGTTLEKIRSALKWGKFTGIQAKLTLQQMKSLVAELNGREDCEEILEDLKDKISDEEGVKEEKEDVEAILADEVFQTESEIQAARKKAAEDFEWKNFPDTFKGLKKIGVHETKSENVDSLVSNDHPSLKWIPDIIWVKDVAST